MNKVIKNYALAVTSPYGQRSSGFHGGIDLVGNNNGIHVLDYIIAIDKGVVTNLRKDCQGFEDNGSYGNFVHIDHKNGLSTVYAHMEYGTICVERGQTVEKGQVIGYMGNTGHSFGGHLHFEVRLWNEKIDPTDYALYDKKIIADEILSPNPIDRNKDVNQINVIVGNTIYCRTSPDNTIENKVEDNFAKVGFYNILSEIDNKGYHWYELEKDRWIAQVDGYVEYIAKYVPILNKEGQNSPVIPPNTEISENKPIIEDIKDNTIEIINNDKKNPLIEFLKWFFNVILKLMKGDK